ncbi:hypothetical protein B1R94_20765 [Mycolicibacterium litorale]|nr:hypothetical protein B1R94_20765 [Mycolicibacterium litorale]
MTIIVAIITLTGVWRTVRDKWKNDRINDVWNRFVWLADPERVDFLKGKPREEIFSYLERNAGKLRDGDLKRVVHHWTSEQADSAYKKLKNAAAKAIHVLATIRNDGSVPDNILQEVRDTQRDLTNSLAALISEQAQATLTAPSPPSTTTATTPAATAVMPAQRRLVLRQERNPEPIDGATATRLGTAHPELQTLQNQVKEGLQTARAAVAEAIAERLIDHAKMVSYQQVSTTSLLAEAKRYQQFRGEWEAAANNLRELLANADATQIRWRAVRPVSAALSDFLSDHVQQFDEILSRYGYYVAADARVSPDKLVRTDELDDMEAQLAALFDEELRVQQDDIRARIDPLWQ